MYVCKDAVTDWRHIPLHALRKTDEHCKTNLYQTGRSDFTGGASDVRVSFCDFKVKYISNTAVLLPVHLLFF
jgi:hypothetical protein